MGYHVDSEGGDGRDAIVMLLLVMVVTLMLGLMGVMAIMVTVRGGSGVVALASASPLTAASPLPAQRSS